MINVQVDTRDAERYLDDVGRRQLPFATSVALNDTGRAVQAAIRNRITASFTLRRADFILRTVKIEREDFARKDNLRVIVGIDQKRDVLAKFEKGGRKAPREGRSIAIPVDARRGKTGIVQRNQRPRSFNFKTAGGSIQGNRKTFIIKPGKGTPGIYQRVGRGKSAIVRLLYVFKPSVRIDRRLGFADTARQTVTRTWSENFSRAFQNAMRTAR